MEYLHAIVLLAPLSLILFSAERVLVALRRLFSE
jgi:hypothetical protein